MSVSRWAVRMALTLSLAVATLGAGLAPPAAAAPICTSTPSGTTCVDPTGACLVAFYPRVGPASCLRNPIGPIT